MTGQGPPPPPPLPSGAFPGAIPRVPPLGPAMAPLPNGPMQNLNQQMGGLNLGGPKLTPPMNRGPQIVDLSDKKNKKQKGSDEHYEGYTFRLARTAEGNRGRTWARCERTPMDVSEEELAKAVRLSRKKGHSAMSRLDGLGPKQRQQLEHLVQQKKDLERDPNAKWLIVYVKAVRGASRSRLASRAETSSINVILQRTLKTGQKNNDFLRQPNLNGPRIPPLEGPRINVGGPGTRLPPLGSYPPPPPPPGRPGPGGPIDPIGMPGLGAGRVTPGPGNGIPPPPLGNAANRPPPGVSGPPLFRSNTSPPAPPALHHLGPMPDPRSRTPKSPVRRNSGSYGDRTHDWVFNDDELSDEEFSDETLSGSTPPTTFSDLASSPRMEGPIITPGRRNSVNRPNKFYKEHIRPQPSHSPHRHSSSDDNIEEVFLNEPRSRLRRRGSSATKGAPFVMPDGRLRPKVHMAPPRPLEYELHPRPRMMSDVAFQSPMVVEDVYDPVPYPSPRPLPGYKVYRGRRASFV